MATLCLREALRAVPPCLATLVRYCARCSNAAPSIGSPAPAAEICIHAHRRTLGRTRAAAGWMWSHGYNYHERHRDREAIMANALKDSDQHAYNLMRRWGVRYVLGENMHRHHRPSEDAYRQALAEKAAQPDNPDLYVPHFDADMYLDGMLKRVASAGRFEVFEVLGYNSIPN
ncbi:MAG: hypothetical protein EOO65_03250 [Methanosarcinales archaeon]|nr:MAG: hypothetical protein EOO65_03250 [Methanosarcinales archaeon]